MAEQLAELNKGDTLENYTEDERVVGTYLGKPLYQITLKQSGTITNRVNILGTQMSALNIKKAFKKNVIYDVAYNGTPLGTRGEYWAGTSDYLQSILDVNSFFPMFAGTGNTYSNLELTIQYIKTTD